MLRDQLSVLDWIYQDAEGRAFNVDVYVPPVIPYASYPELCTKKSLLVYGPSMTRFVT